MAKFDAGSSAVAEPLDYDFSLFKAGKGTITEPNDDQIRLFGVQQVLLQRKVIAVSPELGDDATLDQRLEAIATAGQSEVLASHAADEAAIYADLCSGKPSAGELLKLPPRHRQRFYKWLQEEINPEADAGGGTAGD
jgi:hypothetical protein